MKVATILTSGLSNTTFYRRNIYFVAPPLSPFQEILRQGQVTNALDYLAKLSIVTVKKVFVSLAPDVAL
jgi:hypothetical protein